MIFLVLIFVAQITLAAGLKMNLAGPSESEVYAKIAELRTSLKAIHPTNSVVMSACEEKSGAVFSDFSTTELSAKSFVYCISITTQMKNSEAAVSDLVAGSAFTGIIIHINNMNLF